MLTGDLRSGPGVGVQTFVFLLRPHATHREYPSHTRLSSQLVPIQWNSDSQRELVRNAACRALRHTCNSMAAIDGNVIPAAVANSSGPERGTTSPEKASRGALPRPRASGRAGLRR